MILGRKRPVQPVRFVPVATAFKPQVEVTMTRDVSGWVDRKLRLKWALKAGHTYMLDEDRAVEFITKGYGAGELPRPVSSDEREHYLSQMSTIKVSLPNG